MVVFELPSTAILMHNASVKSLFLCTMLAVMPTPPNSASATRAVNAFGVDVLNKTVPEGNAFVSPYSIQVALAMTYAGAAGDTRRQMAKTLHYGNDAVASFAALSRELKPAANRKVTLAIANRLFVQEDYDFHPEYLATIKRDFGTPIEQMDFKKSPAAAAKLINAWVEEQTRKRIRNLISPGDIDASTRLVLANAVYFHAPWEKAFDEKETRPTPFTMLDGKTRDVPMMHLTKEMDFCEAADFVAVGLPYAGGDFRFVAILPKGDFKKFKLTTDTFKKLEEIKFIKVVLSMPKFRLEPPVLALSKFLKEAGMPSAFDVPPGSADFSGIAPRDTNDYLAISGVFHKAFLDVSEEGTEAAAATAVIMMTRASILPPADPPVVNLDRPFYFAIQHRPIGACLFLGRLVEP